MSIEVTTRHMNAPGAKEYAHEKAERLVELFPRIEHVHVILDVEKHRYEAEIVVQAITSALKQARRRMTCGRPSTWRPTGPRSSSVSFVTRFRITVPAVEIFSKKRAFNAKVSGFKDGKWRGVRRGR